MLEQAPQAVVPEHGRIEEGLGEEPREVRRSRRLLAEAGEQASDADVSPFERRGGTLRSVGTFFRSVFVIVVLHAGGSRGIKNTPFAAAR